MNRTTMASPHMPTRWCRTPDSTSTSQTTAATTATATTTIHGEPTLLARAVIVMAAMMVPGPAMSDTATGTMS